MSATAPDEMLVNPAEIAELEVFTLRRMREHTQGEHASIFSGAGFNVVGVREWEPGDPMSSIDWPQSSIRNFSPLITRQLEQDSTATLLLAADASRSTFFGSEMTVRQAIARGIAVLGLSAAFCQDQVGMVVFDDRCKPVTVLRPRSGRGHVMHCLTSYASGTSEGDVQSDLVMQIRACLRTVSMVVVISDFLMADAPQLLDRLSRLAAQHDVLLVMIDARMAFELHAGDAGWIELYDVETGQTRTVSRRQLTRLREDIAQWQQQLARQAALRGMDLLLAGAGRGEMERALFEFFAARRLQKLRG